MRSLPFNFRAWPVLAFLVLLAGSPPPSHAQNSECPSFPKIYLLRSEPVQVNPGARCQYSILFQYEREGFANYALPNVPDNVCFYVRRAGHAEPIGPICSQKKGSIGLPRDLEYIWSDGKVIWATVRLKPRGRQ